MGVFQVSEDFYHKLPVIRLLSERGGAAALSLWVSAGSWCAKYAVDGVVPGFVVRSLARKRSRAAAYLLVEVGLWSRVDNGFRFVESDLWRIPRSRGPLPRLEVFARDKWACVYCSAAVTIHSGHADHVIPWSRGGSDEMDNLVTSCSRCNLSKGPRTPEEWRS